MFKTEEQINSRLTSENNLVNKFGKKNEVQIIPLKQPGNIEKPKLEPEQKDEIAFRARAGEKQEDLAKEFGVSQSAIGEIEQGRTKVNERLVQDRLDEVQDVALQKLLGSLGFITEDKLQKAKAGELSVIASNMSKVVGNIRQKETTGPQVIVQVYAPELKSESSYKVLDV